MIRRPYAIRLDGDHHRDTEIAESLCVLCVSVVERLFTKARIRGA